MNSNRKVRIILNILLWFGLVLLDQITKYLAVNTLKNKPSISIIPKIFCLQYLENRGAAFGMLQNQHTLFIIVAAIMLLAIFYLLIKMPLSKRFYLLNTTLILIAAGAVGNLIDRVMNNYVVDFFYFEIINFPIFNVADIYVTVACILLLISFLFVYTEEELNFYKARKNEIEE